MSEPEIGTPHAEAHNATALEPHDHLHGHGPGQHVHEGWEPSRVIERMKRDGFCAVQVPREGGSDVCMQRAGVCTEHAE